MQRRFTVWLFATSLLFITSAAAQAQSTAPSAAASPAGSGAAPAGAAASRNPAAYDTFTKGATTTLGLFPIIEKDGTYFLEVQKSQLGVDFIETSIPSSGFGGFGPSPGEPYVAPARILRFERHGNAIVLRWPNTYARVSPNSPESAGVHENLPDSVIALTPVIAQDDKRVVIALAPFLGDIADLASSLQGASSSPLHAYHLDGSKSFFLSAKAFPKNDVLTVDQTWSSGVARPARQCARSAQRRSQDDLQPDPSTERWLHAAHRRSARRILLATIN